MSIGPIEAIGGGSPIGGLAPIGGLNGGPEIAETTPSTTGTDFAAMLSNGLQRVEATQDRADALAVQAATGQLADVHEYMIAANEAALTTQLTAAVRNKAIEAFNEIMRLQA
jgi:flagellar hook-basal body complex protein FliE